MRGSSQLNVSLRARERVLFTLDSPGLLFDTSICISVTICTVKKQLGTPSFTVTHMVSQVSLLH